MLKKNLRKIFWQINYSKDVFVKVIPKETHLPKVDDNVQIHAPPLYSKSRPYT